MTRNELIQKSEAIQKSAKKNFLPVLAYVVLLAGWLWWANFQKNIISERMVQIIGGTGFFGIYIVLIMTALLAGKRRKKFGCACPNCKRELASGTLRVAIASGRCGYCGGIVVEDWNK